MFHLLVAVAVLSAAFAVLYSTPDPAPIAAPARPPRYYSYADQAVMFKGHCPHRACFSDGG